MTTLRMEARGGMSLRRLAAASTRQPVGVSYTAPPPTLPENGGRMEASMDGEIIYPGDLQGRVIRANAVELAWDGNCRLSLVRTSL